ncbi:MAG: hypothetical protein JWM49_1087 [Microbacteriaceae bacterium]|nr:hypothetical protein [Microbacteriaceae bacterium]
MRNAERGEDWSPDDVEIAAGFRALWAAQTTLVWASYQLERWLERFAEVTEQAGAERTPMLKALRGALEHLDDADLADGRAKARSDDWSLRKLPDSELFIGSGGRFDLFNIVDVRSLEKVADDVIAAFTPLEPDFS